jgi:hypothetical protein
MTDCPASAPICGADGACRKCEAHAECPSLGMWPAKGGIPATMISGICVLEDFATSNTTFKAGTCAPSNQVAFVDNQAQPVGTCKGSGTHDGTSVATAFCDVQDAVGGSTGKAFVVVAGRGTNAYGGGSTGGTDVNITRAVTLVGPGGQATTTAQISSGASATPDLSVGMAVQVVVDGFEIGPSTSGIGLACTGVNTVLTARRNWIHGNGGVGVNASTCTLGVYGSVIENDTGGGVNVNNSTVTLSGLTVSNSALGVNASTSTIMLDGSFIQSNTTGGVRLATSTYTLTNNIIGVNGSLGGGYGVRIDDSPAGSLFAFNTVARNASDGNSPPGVICNAAATLQSSIVAENSPLFNGSQVTKPACTLKNVVTGTDSANTNMAAPKFLSTTNFHLDISNTTNEQTNKTCCIDQLTATGTPNADHDVDFTPRPKGTGPKNFDIGAQEAE